MYKALRMYMDPVHVLILSRLAPRYLNMSAHVAAETQQQGADNWFDKTTWSRSIGSSLLTVAMSQARSTMVSVLA